MEVKIIVNNKEIICEDNLTILEVCKQNNIEIPTLCYLKGVLEEGSCRICIVENKINGRLIPACSTKVYNNLNILTKSPKVIASRTQTLKLLLERHHKNCDECSKNKHCSLQNLFNEYNVYKNKNHTFKAYKIDKSSPCIVRDNNKCILCGRCVSICSNTQNVNALTKQNRGINTFVGCEFNKNLKCSTCVGCGQCTLVCPTGALVERSEINDVLEVLKEKTKKVYAQVAPSVRVALAEEFGNNVGTFDEGKMVSALKKLGFDKVFDINFGADFTVYEESKELIERIKNNEDFPLFSSCCPAWFKFIETNYPEAFKGISSCKSPTEMLGAIIKNYYSQKNNINKDDIIVVGIMPCTAKKGEKQRGKDVDYVLTTRELASLIKAKRINYNKLTGEKFDMPLSNYSGGGLIFGATGGVTEAVLRHVAQTLGKSKQIEFNEVRGINGRKEAIVKCGKITLNLCVVSGLNNAKQVLDDVIQGKKHYNFIEVMACPGGCVNGGGQTYVNYNKIDVNEVKLLRAKGLYDKDKSLKIRSSNKNKMMNDIYKEFFIPSPNKAKELLHRKD